MKKLRIAILIVSLCAYLTGWSQIQNIFEGPVSLDTAGVLTIYSNNNFSSNAIYSIGNSSGLPGATSSYAMGYLSGYNVQWSNYGVWGHATGQGVGGQGGLFTYGSDRLAPDRFVSVANGSHALQIVDGNEADGYVLTSDAVGNAIWAPPGAGLWTLSGNDIYYDTGNVGVNITAIPNSELFVFTPDGYAGPDTSGIYSIRVGSSVSNADGAGSGWDVNGVSSAIRGFSDYGNTFSAGVAGYGYLDYVNSAALIGSKQDASVWGALGYRDSTNRNWGGYIGAGDFFVNGMSAGVQGVFGEDGYDYASIYTNANILAAVNSMVGSFQWYPSLALVNTQDSSGCTFFGVRASDGGGVNVGDTQGNAYADVNAAAFNVGSDRSVKKDIVTIDQSNVERYLEYIRNIESASFRYKMEDETSRPAPHIGVIAQTLPDETVAVMKRESGRADSDDILGVSLADLLGLTLVGVKHLDAENQAKDAKIADLESRIEALEQALNVLLETDKK